MKTGAYAVQTFEEFWPHYVGMHTRPETQWLHAAGTLTCLGLVALGAATRSPALALLGPIADYAISQTSHRVFERNRTTPWKNNLWHSRAELRMLRLVLSGRMAGEVARVASAAPVAAE